MKGLPLCSIFSALVISSLLGPIGVAQVEPEPTATPPVEIKTAELDSLQAELTTQRDAEGICAKQATLKILRSGQLEREYDLTQRSGFCYVVNLAVRKLDSTGEPKILVDNFSGGAHCCTTSWIYGYDAKADRYVFTQHHWGNAGYRLEDLNRDRIPEFRTRDDNFAYAFASYAGSFYPPQIWSYQQGRMVNVTRQYPQVIKASAFQLWQHYQETKTDIEGGRAALAAYLAAKYLLGEAIDGWQRVETAYQQPDRTRFFGDLRKFLQDTGYTAIPQQ